MILTSPNTLYYVALFVWPLVAYKLFDKDNIGQFAFRAILIPFLLLPKNPDLGAIDLPILPALDKSLISVLSIFIILKIKKIPFSFLPKNKLSASFILVLFTAPFFTMFANLDALYYGPKVLPGLGIKDALSTVMENLFFIYLPFMFGYLYLRGERSHQFIIETVALLGLMYSALMLWEVRMSPQLHVNFYGFFPHQFAQSMREGGFRPVVFLGHGLLVSFFAMLVCTSFYVLWQEKSTLFKGKSLHLLVYMFVVLVLCKTYSALIYLIIILATMHFLSQKASMRIFSSLAVLLIAYPVIRGAEILPLDALLDFFRSISEERADSLGFRFDNEDGLLAHANEHSLFGWGSWGRNHLWHDYDGRMLSVTDGSWIVVFGCMGWAGYLATFGLIVQPVLALRKRLASRGAAPASLYTLALVGMLALYLLDQIPNSSMDILVFVIAGSVIATLTPAKKLATKPRAEAQGAAELESEQV